METGTETKKKEIKNNRDLYVLAREQIDRIRRKCVEWGILDETQYTRISQDRRANEIREQD